MKKYFLTGLIILLPLVLTIMVVVFLVDLFTNPFVDVVTEFFKSVFGNTPLLKNSELLQVFSRIIILVCLTFFLVLLGFLARRFIFKTLLSWMNRLMAKIPMIRSIYSVMKDLLTALFSDKEKRAFTRTLLIPFPSKKSTCVGFETGQVPPTCQKLIDEELISVFVPTAPHPISGYLMFVAKDSVTETAMTKEEAIKFTVSCGVITSLKDEKK